MESRVEALETKLAYAESAHEQLSDELIVQQKTLDRVLLRLEKLEQQMRDLSDNAGGQAPGPADEVPPHY